MNVALFFTYDVSLSEWDRLKIIDREMKFYTDITKDDSDISFTLVTYGNQDDLKYENKYKNIRIIPLYSLKKRPVNKYIRLIDSLFLPFRIKKYLNDVDILKTNQLLGSWVPIVLKRILNKPLIIRTGYDLFSFSLRQKKNLFKLLFYYLLTQLAIITSSVYLVSSREDMNFLKKYFYWNNNNKLQIRQNWISAEENSNFLDREKKSILTVGRLEKQKNLYNLITKFKNTDFSLDIVGEGSLRDSLVLHSNQSKVETNFLGIIDHNKLLNLYQHYKYFILNSTYEGHPKALIEAMSRGCIVIVNKSSNVQEIISHNVNGILFDSKNENPIDIIRNLNKNNQIALKISNEASRFAFENYSIDKLISIEITGYKSLLEN